MTVTRGMLDEPARGRRASWPRPGRLASVFTRQPRTQQGDRASTGWNDSPPTARVDRPVEPDPGRLPFRGRHTAGPLPNPVRPGLVHAEGYLPRREVAASQDAIRKITSTVGCLLIL